MKKNIQRANERGTANHGWLKANFSFSFANYYNPKKVSFGALRVLNDDTIEPAMGFGKHPHDNMEIITIPLEGALKHRDSMSDTWITLETGEVQIMSAGSGLMHSEMNNSTTEHLNLFQIWIVPNRNEVTPRYDQKRFDTSARKNKLQMLVSSIDKNEANESLKIHQDAQISRIDLSENTDFNYQLKSENHGVFVMVISGEIATDNEVLTKRDTVEISQTKTINLKAKNNSELLFIEVPMLF